VNGKPLLVVALGPTDTLLDVVFVVGVLVDVGWLVSGVDGTTLEYEDVVDEGILVD